MERIDPEKYTYTLPGDRIATHPLRERDESKLLVYKKGNITHTHFTQLGDFIPENSILFFNDTKVIPARLLFTKPTGAAIEIFLLSPHPASRPIGDALRDPGRTVWRCLIGNQKRWSPGTDLVREADGIRVSAQLVDRENGIVELSWTPGHLTLNDVISASGATPLPPYLNREAVAEDRERYQTVYSAVAGAVAAPTAGLHFTATVLGDLNARGIMTDFLTLHVGAGTFQPLSVDNAVEHPMHAEQVCVPAGAIRHLLLPEKKIIAVGTTSLRTLESLYWYGVNLLNDPEAAFVIEKMAPYQDAVTVTVDESLSAVLALLDRKKLTEIRGETSIYLLPGYSFRVCDALITNFHQPGSTLMLLVAAFVGDDWKLIYREALANDYRFLSYGDSSLLMP
jgi:S-adenosylmethionine:tRNA ribosyltransferase-isomerase